MCSTTNRATDNGAIDSRHFKELLYLLELDTQCKLADRTFKRLELAAKARKKHEEVEGQSGAPIEILHLAHSFVTYAGIISKFIFEGKRRNPLVTARCATLRELLDISQSPLLEDLTLRNSFEHIDEKMDTYIPDPPCTIVPYAVGGPDGHTGEIVIRRFDPEKIELCLLENVAQLRPLMEEIKIVLSRINSGLGKLSTASQS